jgi:hypothetical protein
MSYDSRTATTAYDGGKNSGPAPNVRNTLIAQVHALDDHISFAYQMGGRLQEIADQLFGPVPAAINEGAKEPTPDGGPVALVLERKHNDLGRVLARINEALQRLEGRVH